MLTPDQSWGGGGGNQFLVVVCLCTGPGKQQGTGQAEKMRRLDHIFNQRLSFFGGNFFSLNIVMTFLFISLH